MCSVFVEFVFNKPLAQHRLGCISKGLAIREVVLHQPVYVLWTNDDLFHE